MTAPNTGYLLIADITGYTAYLSASELDHAQGTLTALLEVLLDQTRPPLVLSRLAGDAVISYALGDAFATGQTFLELIDGTYVAFRRAIDRMVLNNTCPCTACAMVGSLDLKFFVHYGTFARQKLSAHEELLGNDVNLLHRLLKNHVVEATGIRAYAVYTQAAIEKLGLEGLTQQMRPHSESYDHLGDVQLWVADMSRVWETRKATPGEELRKVMAEASADVAMDPPAAWDFLTSPEHLRSLLGASKVAFTRLAGGRVAPGTVYHCFHGGASMPLTVLEWTPFERILLEYDIPLPISKASAQCEYVLVPTGNGTRITQRMGTPTGPWLGRTIATRAMSKLAPKWLKDMAAFKAHIEAEHAARSPVPAGVLPTADEVQDAVRSGLQATKPPMETV